MFSKYYLLIIIILLIQIMGIGRLNVDAQSNLENEPSKGIFLQVDSVSKKRDVQISEDVIYWIDSRPRPPITQTNLFKYDINDGVEEKLSLGMNSNTFFGFLDVYGSSVIIASYHLWIYDDSNKSFRQIETEGITNGLIGNRARIYKNRIVWADERNINQSIDNLEIYLYDITENDEIKLTQNLSTKLSPDIYKDIVIWTDGRNINHNRNWDIYLHNLSNSEETQITTNTFSQSNAKIFENIILWEDFRNGEDNPDIYSYNLSSHNEKPLITFPSAQRYPEIFKDKIIWVDNRSGNWDIFLFDLSLNKEYIIRENISADSDIKTRPQIYGDKIVWIESKESRWEDYIYWCDLGYDSEDDGLPNFYDTDDDNDGFTDEEEIAAGTDPIDPTSHPQEQLSFWEEYGLPISVSGILVVIIIIMLLLRLKYKKPKKT